MFTRVTEANCRQEVKNNTFSLFILCARAVKMVATFKSFCHYLIIAQIEYFPELKVKEALKIILCLDNVL